MWVLGGGEVEGKGGEEGGRLELAIFVNFFFLVANFQQMLPTQVFHIQVTDSKAQEFLLIFLQVCLFIK